jgi:hypothetical protein
LIFDCDHQFQVVEPVGTEIIGEMGFIRDPRDVDTQMLGNESADSADGEASLHRDRPLARSRAMDAHDEAPRFVPSRYSTKKFARQYGVA